MDDEKVKKLLAAQQKREEKRLKKQNKIDGLLQKRFEKRLSLLSLGKLRKKGKIALCLGGGGARGFAHIGIIKALEEANIDFDLCVGTSVGALVGALYCAGVSADEMMEFGRNLEMKEIHSRNVLFPASTDGIASIVEKFVPSDSFADLKRSFCAVATDLVSASEVMLTDGSLSQAVAASCAVPQFFKPVVRGDMHLVDGGLLNNIPADVCRVLGADYVVMCDVNPTRGEGTAELGSIAVVKATISIMMANSSYKGYINSDVIIAPDTQQFRSTSKKGYEEMFERGYNAAKAAIKQIVTDLYW